MVSCKFCNYMFLIPLECILNRIITNFEVSSTRPVLIKLTPKVVRVSSNSCWGLYNINATWGHPLIFEVCYIIISYRVCDSLRLLVRNTSLNFDWNRFRQSRSWRNVIACCPLKELYSFNPKLQIKCKFNVKRHQKAGLI